MRILYDYAMKFVGLEYHWGGDDPIVGFDCSGFVQELLISCGAHPDPKQDFTAQGLYNHFEKSGSYSKYGLGALAFYGQSALRVTHVAMLLDTYRIIEAGGGGADTLTTQIAAKRNAFIRIRSLKHRKDLVAVIMPSYASIGYTG